MDTIKMMKDTLRSIIFLNHFVAGNLKPTERQLDEHLDTILELLEKVNDARYPEAMASELAEGE